MLTLAPFAILFKNDRYTVFDIENSYSREGFLGLGQAVVDYHTAMKSVWFDLSEENKKLQIKRQFKVKLPEQESLQDSIR